MNPIILMDFDLSFIKNIFGSKEDEDKSKKENKEKSKNEKKNDDKGIETKKDKDKEKTNEYSYKSSDTALSEEEVIKQKISDEEKLKNEINTEDKKEEKEINKIEEEIKVTKKDSNKKIKVNKKKKKGKKTKEELLNFLVSYIKNAFLYKKSVKKLIQRQKENYSIISSLKNGDIYMEIYLSEDKSKKVKSTFEPILKENIFYIPKSQLKKKNLLKFSFINKKKECIIDPKFNTEYDSGEFINVINLKKIKDKEEEREEDFQTFLESYYTLKQSMSKDNHDINKLKLEVVRVKKKHRTMDSHKGGLLFNGNKIPSNSILKQRGSNRKISSKKISFSDKNETIAYKKDD